MIKFIKHLFKINNPMYYKYDWLCSCKGCKFLRFIKVK